MAQAAIASWETYRHDLVTVGIDIYNIEAEAFGCRVSSGDGTSIPGIVSHPLAEQNELNPDALQIPRPGPSNRLELIVEASTRVRTRIGEEVWVNACMGGPFSQAVELRGFENLVMDMLEAPERVHALLEKTTELSMQQAARLSETGCGVNLFESWATIPLIDPPTFGTYVVPYNKRVIDMILASYHTPPPSLIMGGNTAKLMDHFIEAGTSLVVADFNTDFDFMRAKTAGRRMMVRGCVDPKLIEKADWPRIEEQAARLAAKARGMNNFVWGCGAVSYNTRPEDLLRFREICTSGLQA
jgi:uroporphyrinogen decarboxylase